MEEINFKMAEKMEIQKSLELLKKKQEQMKKDKIFNFRTSKE